MLYQGQARKGAIRSSHYAFIEGGEMNKWKIAIACFMVLALVATLCFGCAKKEEKGKVVIIIGDVTDMTGPASTALIPIVYVLDDLVKYYNEENLIPGVELKMIHYDAKYDPSRDLPGYYWCIGKGAKVIVTPLPTTGESLIFQAERDKVPVACQTATIPQIETPRWNFTLNVPAAYLIKTLLEWVSENHPDFPTDRPATIGVAGWQESFMIDVSKGVEEYCEDNPTKFEYVGEYLTPMGGVTWSGEVAKLKGCDYVVMPGTGTGISTFVNAFRVAGGTATFLQTDAGAAYRGLLVDACGWDRLDGTLTTHPSLWWGEPNWIVELCEETLHKYHPAEEEEVIHSGIGYIGSFEQYYAFFEILKAAIEAVGAENFSGQAFYDTAITYTGTWEGFEPWGFTATKRYTWNATIVWEWDKDVEDLVRASDWLALVQ